MHEREFRSKLSALVESVSDRLGETDLRHVRGFYDVGEETLAIELIAAALMEESIPVTAQESKALRELLYSYDLPVAEQYINRRDEVMDSLNVVDEGRL